jgi:hypothetical protein
MLQRSSIKAVAVASIIALSALCISPHMHYNVVDFRAFYCAGQAALSGADPYLEHPLHECEQQVSAPGFPVLDFGATVPAPFPGFVIMLFAGLALLPFAWAMFLWGAAASLAVGLAVVLVARTTRTPVMANAIVFGFPAVVVALQLGQVTPFVLLAVAAAAALLQTGRPRLAAFASLGALIDPHVGLALWVGLLVGVPRARVVLIAGAALLVASGSLVAGPLREWEYLRVVVPAHALANLTEARQFSASNFAFEAGLAPALALAFGSVWYAAALAAGTAVALRLRNGLGSATMAYIPVAFAVFGGTHTHLAQLAIAVPAFMLLTSAARGRQRDFCCVVTFVAAMPWLIVAPFPWLFAVPTVLAVVFAREINCAGQGIRLAAGSLIALAVIMQSILRTHTERNIVDIPVAGNPLAEVSWQIFTVARNVPVDSWYFVARAPTVIAFVLLFGALIAAAGRKPIVAGGC